MRGEVSIVRGVGYAEGGGSSQDVWNMQKEVRPYERCRICRRGRDMER